MMKNKYYKQLRISFSKWSRMYMHYLKREKDHIQITTTLELEQHTRTTIMNENDLNLKLKQTLLISKILSKMMTYANYSFVHHFQKWKIYIQNDIQNEKLKRDHRRRNIIKFNAYLIKKCFHEWKLKYQQSNEVMIIFKKLYKYMMKSIAIIESKQLLKSFLKWKNITLLTSNNIQLYNITKITSIFTILNKRINITRKRKAFHLLMRNMMKKVSLHSLEVMNESIKLKDINQKLRNETSSIKLIRRNELLNEQKSIAEKLLLVRNSRKTGSLYMIIDIMKRPIRKAMDIWKQYSEFKSLYSTASITSVNNTIVACTHYTASLLIKIFSCWHNVVEKLRDDWYANMSSSVVNYASPIRDKVMLRVQSKTSSRSTSTKSSSYSSSGSRSSKTVRYTKNESTVVSCSSSGSVGSIGLKVKESAHDVHDFSEDDLISIPSANNRSSKSDDIHETF
jgi:hypothetical protein